MTFLCTYETRCYSVILALASRKQSRASNAKRWSRAYENLLFCSLTNKSRIRFLYRRSERRLQDEIPLFRNYSLFYSLSDVLLLYRLPSSPRFPLFPIAATLRPPTTVLFRSHFATLPSQLHLLEPGAAAESYIGGAKGEWKRRTLARGTKIE